MGLRIMLSNTSSFNPRTRVGCDQRTQQERVEQQQFQSTHPRGVRQGPLITIGLAKHVSIHAPAWGATRRFLWYPCVLRCFNPRTRVGCDHHHREQSGAPHCFNPRTRVGCDAMRTNRYRRFFEVSIHAPAWGATIEASIPSGPPVMFQSTHPRGVRRDTSRHAQIIMCFNPRTRVGCDIFFLDQTLAGQRVSIHAPAWGATVSMFYPVDSRD